MENDPVKSAVPVFQLTLQEKKNLFYLPLSKNFGRLWLYACLVHMRQAKDAGRVTARLSG
jgi:hypothetical protein